MGSIVAQAVARENELLRAKLATLEAQLQTANKALEECREIILHRCRCCDEGHEGEECTCDIRYLDKVVEIIRRSLGKE